jgi:hypothetical protein
MVSFLEGRTAMKTKTCIATSIAMLWTALSSGQSAACEVKRDSLEKGGQASATMVMVNDGKPCLFKFRFGGQNPPDSWELVSKPQSGTVQFRDDVAEYQPNPGFTGSDKFVVAVFGKVPGGKTRDVRDGRFEVAVTVNAKP